MIDFYLYYFQIILDFFKSKGIEYKPTSNFSFILYYYILLTLYNSYFTANYYYLFLL